MSGLEAAGATPAGSAAGSIYDLGYRGYEGPRLGRRHAVAALFSHSLRSCFGIGRGGRAKVIPFGLAFLAVLPAIAALAITGVASRFAGNGLALITYDTYSQQIGQFLVLFVAAQAPELLGRDLRHGVLTLYFSRALRRIDYALAKLAALSVALAVIQLVPQVLLFVGHTLASTDLVGAASHDADKLPPVLAKAVLSSVLLAAVSLAIASFAARRAYATAGIIAAFIIQPVVAAVVDQFATSDLGREIILLSPPDLVDGANAFLFGTSRASTVASQVPLVQFALAAVAMAVVASAILLRRYQRVAA